MKLYHKVSWPEAPDTWMAIVAKGPDCTFSDDNLKALLQAMVGIQVRTRCATTLGARITRAHGTRKERGGSSEQPPSLPVPDR
jgi:hypothetical protein